MFVSHINPWPICLSILRDRARIVSLRFKEKILGVPVKGFVKWQTKIVQICNKVFKFTFCYLSPRPTPGETLFLPWMCVYPSRILVRCVTLQPLMGFLDNSTQMVTTFRWCAEPKGHLPWLKVKGVPWVRRSRSSISNILSEMFTTLRQYAGCMSHWPRFRVKVTLRP